MAFRTTPENMSTISSVAGVVRLGGKSNARKSDVLPLGGGAFCPQLLPLTALLTAKFFALLLFKNLCLQ